MSGLRIDVETLGHTSDLWNELVHSAAWSHHQWGRERLCYNRWGGGWCRDVRRRLSHTRRLPHIKYVWVNLFASVRLRSSDTSFSWTGCPTCYSTGLITRSLFLTALCISLHTITATFSPILWLRLLLSFFLVILVLLILLFCLSKQFLLWANGLRRLTTHVVLRFLIITTEPLSTKYKIVGYLSDLDHIVRRCSMPPSRGRHLLSNGFLRADLLLLKTDLLLPLLVCDIDFPSWFNLAGGLITHDKALLKLLKERNLLLLCDIEL